VIADTPEPRLTAQRSPDDPVEVVRTVCCARVDEVLPASFRRLAVVLAWA
jgi:hypothetical protein